MENITQQLRSIIIHSLDSLNYNNAEFAGERLVAIDKSLDSIFLYNLVLFRQNKFKTCYSKLIDLEDHLGCSYIFAKSCLELKKYKEGIYQLLKVGYLYNELDQTSKYFSGIGNRYNYEFYRKIIPDSSVIYHLLGDLFSKVGDIKNSGLNYGLALKYNQFDFEAFQKLCKLGIDVKVKNLFNSGYVPQIPQPLQPSSNEGLPNQGINSPFNEEISTPRVKSTTIPNAPKREFTKPKQSTYSKITSRLVNPNPTPSGNFGASINGTIGGMGPINSTNGNKSKFKHYEMTSNKEIDNANQYLLQLYIVFGKSYKCFSKYDCYKAIRILESLPDNEKETPWVLSKLGRLHYEIVNYKQSEYFFNKLRKLDRTRLEDMEYYSTLLWHLHKKIELTYLANELHDLNSNSPITWCVIGNLFSLNREPDEAIKCFNRAIKYDDSFVYAYTLKGHEYFGNDNYEMALENFRVSLILDPRHYNALYGIGMVYINLGDYEKADYHFKRAVSINPINIILICCVGMVLEKLGKKNLALRQYELANKLQPLNPLPIFKKAQLLFTMQQFTQSLQYFEILKDLAPDEASVHFLLGQLYSIQDDKFRAIKEFTIALNLDPKGNYLIREAMENLQEAH